MRFLILFVLHALLIACASNHVCRCETDAPHSALVLMTDFSLKDGAVSAMKGVAYQVNPRLVISDLTHEVPPFSIWEGAYRLNQTYKYWPAGTVFVTVVDPGVGSARHSVVVKTKSGHYFVGPDNGLYTLISENDALESIRVIDENKQRLKGSEDSNTFHGRDLYVYVGARLASGALTYEQSGELTTTPLVKLTYPPAEFVHQEIKGSVPVLDTNFGNVWSNIPRSLVLANYPGAKSLRARILHNGKTVYDARLPLVETFAAVGDGKPLLYFNSLLNLSLALNQGDFAARFHVHAGPDWTIRIEK